MEAAANDPLSNLTGTIEVKLANVPTIPDPDTVVYEDAIVSAEATIRDGPHKGKVVKLFHWATKTPARSGHGTLEE